MFTLTIESKRKVKYRSGGGREKVESQRDGERVKYGCHVHMQTDIVILHPLKGNCQWSGQDPHLFAESGGSGRLGAAERHSHSRAQT